MSAGDEEHAMAETKPQAPPPDAARDILRRRAKALARPSRDDSREQDALPVVEFILAGERYALDAGHIREVAPVRGLLPLPGAPDFVLGIISLRGEIHSVVDLRRLFGLPERASGEGYAVIIHGPDMEFGLFAEEIIGATMLRPSALEDSLPTLSDIRAEFLKGVTGQGLVYLDAARLLSDPRLAATGERASGAGSTRPRESSSAG
ncbi:MAG: chemotaxis protein CheW [Thermodesulfobacteriota bacterium]